MSPNLTPRPPSPAPAPPDLPKDAVEQGPVCPLSRIVLGGRTMPVGLATRGWPLLPVSSPGGVLAAPQGLGALREGLLPRAASALPGPSESLRPLAAPPPGQGEPLSTATGSRDPHRGLPGSGGRVWAMLPPHLLCGHAERGDGAQRCSTSVHSCLSGPIKLLMHPQPES